MSIASRTRAAAVAHKLTAAGAFAAGVLALGFLAQPAFAQDTGGERIYFDKGQCNQCHGKFGNGVGDDPRESGANFRAMTLDKPTLIMIISCGVPGTNMPYFDKFSYTDDRCYGQTAAQIGSQKPQQPLADFLAKRDISVVADYLLQNFINKGPVKPGEQPPNGATGSTAPEPEH
ncbi:MAG TPA: hypothetical protein VL418_16650 [Devosiaceae bacterium]|jgi:mono/diheme cytochrome c family protein|nr:hypothetical protein [Devosiaceae bacterium]